MQIENLKILNQQPTSNLVVNTRRISGNSIGILIITLIIPNYSGHLVNTILKKNKIKVGGERGRRGAKIIAFYRWYHNMFAKPTRIHLKSLDLIRIPSKEADCKYFNTQEEGRMGIKR